MDPGQKNYRWSGIPDDVRSEDRRDGVFYSSFQRDFGWNPGRNSFGPGLDNDVGPRQFRTMDWRNNSIV